MDSFTEDLKIQIHTLSYLRKIGQYTPAKTTRDRNKSINAKHSVCSVDLL